MNSTSLSFTGCLPVFSYIKPQRNWPSCNGVRVVYQSFPTSNHNCLVHLLPHTSLFTSLFLHQTTTVYSVMVVGGRLFTSLFLHQTTTHQIKQQIINSCLPVFSYIKPQPLGGSRRAGRRCLPVFSYIKPQHWQIHHTARWSCLPVFSYIKPQPWGRRTSENGSCLPVFSYIKPQHCRRTRWWTPSCLPVFSYIKPQPIQLILDM